MRKLVVLGAVCCMAAAVSAVEYRISAPNGVGDVVALTNVFAEMNKADTVGVKILLEPGVYDLSGTMVGSGGSHFRLDKKMSGGLIAGTGRTPGETVILGGGEADKKRIFHFWHTDPKNPMVISNLTLTGANYNGDAGAVYGSIDDYGGNLVVSHCIVSNNYATGFGPGVFRARMYNCFLADNHTSGKNGGGFWSDSPGHGAQNCVFSNNTAMASEGKGGGFYAEGEGSFLVGCDFYGNKAKQYGGGAYVAGASVVSNCGFYANVSSLHGSGARVTGNSLVSNCLFSGNGPAGSAGSTKFGGGIYLTNSECVDCDFIGNYADRGGGAYVSTQTAVLRDCLFDGNIQNGWASGAAVFVNASSPLALVSNCVFNANITRQSSRTVISNAELVDCVITNHHGINGYLLAGCNMTRCYVAYNDVYGNGQHLDVATVYGASATLFRTNVNCVIVGNLGTNGVNSVTDGKTIVNCTYSGNHIDNSSSSANILRGGAAYNTLLVGNRLSGSDIDIRKGSALPSFTNCLVAVTGSGIDESKLFNLKVNSNFKFTPTEDGGAYDIKSSSPAFNAGVMEDWMVPLLGGLDFAGRKRVKYDVLDIGALECQYRPFFGIVVR